jgi:hypothetical protein
MRITSVKINSPVIRPKIGTVDIERSPEFQPTSYPES